MRVILGEGAEVVKTVPIAVQGGTPLEPQSMDLLRKEFWDAA
jgi:hypothetical protein